MTISPISTGDAKRSFEAAAVAKMTPIERMFWQAAKDHSGDAVHLVPSPNELYRLSVSGGVGVPIGDILVAFQVDVVGYRVDFAVTRRRMSYTTIFIECDGHDYHERTKEQAARDRRRDRDIQGFGRIHRFTGSELYRGAFECWEQTVWALDSEQRRDAILEHGAKQDLLVSALCATTPEGVPAFHLGLNALHKIKHSTDRVLFTAVDLESFGVTPDTFSDVKKALQPYLDMTITTDGNYALRLVPVWELGFRSNMGVEL